MGITPWHSIGVVKEGMLTATEAFNLGGLNFLVEACPDYALVDGQYIENPGALKLVRKDKNIILSGDVTARYKILQNSAAFDLCEAVTGGHGEAHFETAGVLDEGRQVWMLCRLAKDIEIAGDAINSWFLLRNGHDGRHPLDCLMTPVRVVCQNTLNMALKGAKRQFTLRHVGNNMTEEDIAKNVAEVLGITTKYFETFETMAKKMLGKKIGASDINRLIDEIAFPIPEGASKRGVTMAEKQRETLRNLLNEKPDLQSINRTAWGLYNAVADFHDHERIVKGAKDVENAGKVRTTKERLAMRSIEQNTLKDEAFKFCLSLV